MPAPVETSVLPVAPRRTPSRLVRGLALAVGVLLVVGVLVVVGRGGGSDEADDGGAALRALMPQLQEDVERLRGLEFKRPVEVELLSDAEFRKRLKAESRRDDKEREELQATQRVFRALKLIDGDVDLEKAVDSLLGSAVAGFYDPEDDELVVRGTSARPSVRATLVHELTHALQDQHFELHRPDLDERDDEAATGFQGLVEGDASRVQELYLQSLPMEEQKQAQQEEAAQAGGIDPSVPRVLLEIVAFPYIVGPQFAQAVVSAGGQARLDAAFAAPPDTSEHLLHPDRFLAGERMASVSHPSVPEGRKQIDEGVFGELGLVLVLASVIGSSGAADAAAGWGGDWYVAWDEGKRSCIRTTIVMDAPAEADQLRTALQRWGERHGAVEIEGSGGSPLTFTACG